MEPNETPMGPEELRPEPQKSKKKVLPYVVCCLATAVVVFALTFVGMTLLQSRQKSTSDDDYLAKVQEVVALLDARYVDGLDHTKLGDELAAAAVSAGATTSAPMSLRLIRNRMPTPMSALA